jgi:L-2-hydroxyglutarate oxidase LhgO
VYPRIFLEQVEDEPALDAVHAGELCNELAERANSERVQMCYKTAVSDFAREAKVLISGGTWAKVLAVDSL